MRVEIERLAAAGVGLDEIKVVAPYNAQVDRLRAVLPAAVEVGTVDKFQGQQARVVFYSMASSSGEDVPRGLEFLFSRNRFNVAISRARVPCVPRLLTAAARGRLQDDRPHAARECAVSVRGVGAGRVKTAPPWAALSSLRDRTSANQPICSDF